ncbi:hypothetical protein EKH80_09500 [Dyella choica]|uniref:Uncharacterized protein n=2 Tax=Dyella choica TaxID=1927959 RepID=A0A432M608_9GAMM|nr:hypothetical protein [Dyella choica]RUL75950.1 hypothetical protein EKH80_09500 [Dyella choica]
MSIFGTIFMMVAVGLLTTSHSALLILPVLVLAAFLANLFRVRRSLSAIRQRTEQAGKVVMWSTIGEGVGIPVAINVVKNFGHPEWVLPAIALVVGLHFIPMAFAIPFKAFYALGAVLVAGSIIGMMLPQPIGAALSGLIAGAGLWVASVLATRRELNWASAAQSTG